MTLLTQPRIDRSEPRSSFAPARSDIQGLRAVAVLLVVLFHAGLPLTPGGYIGVDVFFVISGYLIIASLTRTAEGGHFSAVQFWMRRIRRLLPASFLVLCCTLVASHYLLSPLLSQQYARDAIATTFYGANLHFALSQVDYLSSDLHSPFLHYWSLSTEEQFYIALPLAILALLRFPLRLRTKMYILLLVGGATSFLLNLWWTQYSQPLAFFTLPPRVWQLAVGGLAALCVETGPGRRFLALRARDHFGWAGLFAIVACAVAFSGATPFPGYWAVLPVLGCVAVLVSGAHNTSDIYTGRLQRLLSVPVLVYIGDISYSLYLWHWPLLVIPQQMWLRALDGVERSGLVALSLVLAALTHRLIENPIRRSAAVANRPWTTLSMVVCLMLAVTAVSFLWQRPVALDSGRSIAPVVGGPVPYDYRPPYVPTNAQPALNKAATDVSGAIRRGCLVDFTETNPRACGFGDIASDEVVALIGDSHAEMWVPALDRLGKTEHFKLVTFLKASCPAAEVEAYQSRLNRPFTECDTWRRRVLDKLRRLQPASVVVTDFRGTKLVGSDSQEVKSRGMRTIVTHLRQTGARVWWISDSPEFTNPVPLCLSEHLRDPSYCGAPLERLVPAESVASEQQAVASAGGEYVNVLPWLCPGDACLTLYGQFVMYRDLHHLTATYVRTLSQALSQVTQLSDHVR